MCSKSAEMFETGQICIESDGTAVTWKAMLFCLKISCRAKCHILSSVSVKYREYLKKNCTCALFSPSSLPPIQMSILRAWDKYPQVLCGQEARISFSTVMSLVHQMIQLIRQISTHWSIHYAVTLIKSVCVMMWECSSLEGKHGFLCVSWNLHMHTADQSGIEYEGCISGKESVSFNVLEEQPWYCRGPSQFSSVSPPAEKRIGF